MYDYKAKDQSMKIPPEGGIRNANVLSLIITLYVPSKTAKTYNVNSGRNLARSIPNLKCIYAHDSNLVAKNKNKMAGHLVRLQI